MDGNDYLIPKENIVYSCYKPLLEHLDISKDEYSEWCSENPHNGYPIESSGSLWTCEGKTLNSIVKKLNPKCVLEIGIFKGVSSCHIAHAMPKDSMFFAVDIADQHKVDQFKDYDIIEIYQDSIQFLRDTDNTYDFMWIDGCHEYAHVKKELEIIIERKLTSRILMHDYHVNHKFSKVGEVVDLMRDQFSTFIPIKSEESDCGLVYLEIE